MTSTVTVVAPELKEFASSLVMRLTCNERWNPVDDKDNWVWEEYESRRQRDAAFIQAIPAISIECSIEIGRLMARRFEVMRRIQEYEWRLAMEELRDTPYSGQT